MRTLRDAELVELRVFITVIGHGIETIYKAEFGVEGPKGNPISNRF